MTQLLYNTATTLAAPLGAAYLACRPRYKPLLSRFAPTPPSACLPCPVWIHACPVGEFTVAKPFITAIEERWPGHKTLISVSTVTAHALAKDSPMAQHLMWFPFDQPNVVARTFNRINPRALLLIETELWPNVLRAADARDVPVAVVNARLSDKHFPRYRKWGAFARRMFNRLDLVCAQTDTHAQRFIDLGAPASAVHVTGNLKFDSVTATIDETQTNALRTECGINPENPVLVFGSTRPGDEQLAARCYEALLPRNPELRLIIAPRHVDRVPQVKSLLNKPATTLSQIRNGAKPDPTAIILVDTFGELTHVYSLATVAVVGGSFYPGVEGHNPLEPAALGVPALFGPFMANFHDAADALITAKGAIQVPSPEDLPAALQPVLEDPAAQRTFSENARQAVALQRGATIRTLDLLARLPGWDA